ncbi:MAG: PhnD/SsuA/transferrin family substrate-binding protein [Verrucomicrobiota bacterium]
MSRIHTALLCSLSLLLLETNPSPAAEAALNVVVMDPLALPLSCTCVEGTGQRRYDKLGEYLSAKLNRPVSVVHEEGLALAQNRLGKENPAHLIVGKESVVTFDAENEDVFLRPVARLTGADDTTTLTGVFLVRKDDPAQSLADLAGKTIALGPEEQADTHDAAKAALKKAGVLDEVTLVTKGSIDSAALALTDGEVDAAVVSAFMPALLEGCGKIEPGATRTLAATPPVPFITAFATDELGPELEQQLRKALVALPEDKTIFPLMETASGFTTKAHPRLQSLDPDSNAWLDWRGENRAGYTPHIPKTLPSQPTTIWSAELTGPAMAGVALYGRFLVAPDKSADLLRDIFRCFDANTGQPLWTIEYDAPEPVDYSNAPRATPVIDPTTNLVYLQGALGHLTAAKLDTGKIVWQRNLFTDFGADLLTWGSSVAPLLINGKLIINPGAEDATLAALAAATGETLWTTPGHAAAYSSFIPLPVDGGPTLVIGYDTGSLGAWNLDTGERVWEHIPPDNTDFNVTTPLLLKDNTQLLLATENNATRLHSLTPDGQISPEPVAANDDLAPDTCSPVVVNGKIYATAYGELFCIDLETMKTLFVIQDDMFYDHTNVVAGDDRVLVWSMAGDLLLLDASLGVTEYKVLAHWKPFGDDQLDSMSHPAIVPGKIYLRSQNKLLCLKL